MKIKICGITNLADARYAAAAGADYLGFIQYADSPRYINTREASDLIEWVFGPLCVGVFVNESVDAINLALESAPFDLIQLHGEESVADCQAVERPVIKAFRVSPGQSVIQMRAIMEPYRDAVEYFLLDAHHPSSFGGTGQTIDWLLAGALAMEFPLMLAGGLNPANVSEAVSTVLPAAIDVSSGVELKPGKKDLEKLGSLFEVLHTIDPDRTRA